MIISLNPQRRDDTLEVVKNGDVLTINGDVVDLSGIPEGADLPAEAINNDWIVGKVSRVAGDLHVSLIFPHGPDADENVRFPSDIVDPPDGAIVFPQNAEPAPETE